MESPLTPQRILLVDDVPEGIEILSEIFNMLGHTVQVAYDGVSAISIASWFSPQVVLLDLAMPGMNGDAVAKALRMMPNTRNAAIIALTGFVVNATADFARDAGFDAVLKKPAVVEEILVAIRVALHARGHAPTVLCVEENLADGQNSKNKKEYWR